MLVLIKLLLERFKELVFHNNSYQSDTCSKVILRTKIVQLEICDTPNMRKIVQNGRIVLTRPRLDFARILMKRDERRGEREGES